MSHDSNVIKVNAELIKRGYDESGETLRAFTQIIQGYDAMGEQVKESANSEEAYKKLFLEMLGDLVFKDVQFDTSEYKQRFRELER